MEDSFENENGIIVKDPEVIDRFISHAGLDFFDIVGMGNCSVKDGFEKLIKRDNVFRGVIVRKILLKIKVKKLFLVIKICLIIIKDLIIFLMVFGKENNWLFG